jgi:hypothetical protein
MDDGIQWMHLQLLLNSWLISIVRLVQSEQTKPNGNVIAFFHRCIFTVNVILKSSLNLHNVLCPGTVGRMTLEGCRGHLGTKLILAISPNLSP